MTTHSFQSVPNVILSPHIGGVSDAAYVNMGKGAAANVLAVVAENARNVA
jgi:D-3-phosphoglycerate dehydrogenase